jgi:ABC-type multidrug transport system fused ATPase/permease subunit
MIIISIAHRLSSIENADTIYIFKEGKVVCVGLAQELQAHCKHYQELNQDYKSE